jgi:hypothetical protein
MLNQVRVKASLLNAHMRDAERRLVSTKLMGVKIKVAIFRHG